jgi:hypothetical protein
MQSVRLDAGATPAMQPWYRQLWPWLLMLGPAIVIVAGVITTVIAVARPDAVVVDDYYKRGKAINQDLRRDRAATALKLSVDASYDATAGVLAGTVRSYGRPYAAPLRILLAHATQPEKDLVREARPDAAGRFAVQLGHLDRARWQVVVEGGEREWRLTSGWHWPRTARIAIDADVPADSRADAPAEPQAARAAP